MCSPLLLLPQHPAPTRNFHTFTSAFIHFSYDGTRLTYAALSRFQVLAIYLTTPINCIPRTPVTCPGSDFPKLRCGLFSDFGHFLLVRASPLGLPNYDRWLAISDLGASTPHGLLVRCASFTQSSLSLLPYGWALPPLSAISRFLRLERSASRWANHPSSCPYLASSPDLISVAEPLLTSLHLSTSFCLLCSLSTQIGLFPSRFSAADDFL